MSSSDKVQIAIHIDVAPGVAGGTAQSTQWLVSSLGQLDGPERYILATRTRQQAEWIREHCGSNQTVVMARRISPGRTGDRRRLPREMLKSVVNGVRKVVGRATPYVPRVPLSDGFYESLGCDVLHFPTQHFVLCALPTIFNPHDLQHLHYPQFFTAEDLQWRETLYPAACHYSQTVVVGSQWIKDDVVRQYAVHPDKVQIIPWAPPTAEQPAIPAAQVEDAKRRLALPEQYMLYPAVTWQHKNHLRLLEALAELRDRRGLIVNLVCTGARFQAHWPRIEERIRELNLASQVKFLGFLSESDLRVVYRLAQFLVLPSLFEADSCPIHEAWSEGVPLACSNHTALPDQVADAGLLFDAKDVAAMADAIQCLATNQEQRQQLIERGHRRVKDFDWLRTARAFRAVYRRAAGLKLNEEDSWLLQWDWMREPHRTRQSR
jgi:glycosyltransferase involved in cell wall biosynthesis